MLRRALLGLSRNERAKTLLARAPVTAEVVDRFVAGETTDEVVAAARRLTEAGLLVTIDHLGEDTTDRADAERVVTEYVTLLTRLSDAGLSGSTEVSVKLTALGQALGGDGRDIARENAATICGAAQRAGTTVTLDMEDHTTTDDTLETLAELRKEFPETGAVLQAYLRRTEADCRGLAYAGSRVRLCKGAYAEPESVAFRDQHEVDLSYVRCLKILMVSAGLRGAYHLYQGFGGFVGNLVMGVIFGLIYLRWKRVGPLVVAHTLLDVAAFVGYALLAPRVDWL